VRLVWSVQLNRIDEAFRVEKQIQGWGRAKRLALIEGRYDDLPGLARTAKPSGPDAVVSTSSTDGTTDHGTDSAVVSTSSTDGTTDHGTEPAVVSTSSTDGDGDGVRGSPGR
jgi:hypothetical protein